ncbi:IS4/Tn5 family transposase DNA-binding protein [Trinickia fusca]|uniref:IS4/Tn5 family transposase DNA-binding protein n=1 Tax=Trinickia fusca TaxID=2419777 RepID=UPI001FE50A80|nr:transposase [Trinickia fusca]
MNALALDAPRWTETEFTDLDLGDARLNKRARTWMERLAAKPTAGVPQACRHDRADGTSAGVGYAGGLADSVDP